MRRNTYINRRGKQIIRIATVLAVALLGTTSLAGAEHAQAAIRHYQLNIPRQSLDAALKDLAQQTGLQIGRFSGRIDGSAMVGPVKGDQTPEQALKTLLNNTGLDYKIVSDTTIAVYNPKDSTFSTTGITGSDSPLQAPGEGQGVGDKKGENSSGDRLQLAQAPQGSNSSTPPVAASSPSPTSARGSKGEGEMEEIIVTAQKRTEKLLDVPASISVVGGERLESLQATSLADFASYVPGLTVANGGTPGNNQIVMRGIATNFRNDASAPLVAIYIDESPVGSASNLTRGARLGFDLMPYDIEQIEVLRGPQGTLYGADAMSGLLKYTLRKPNLSQFDARVGGNLQNVSGDGADWGARAAVNIPIVDGKLAVRMSGFYQDAAGYIDNIGLGIKDENHSTIRGGRATMLWQATDRLTVQASILLQDSNASGLTAVLLNGSSLRPVYGPQSNSTALPQPFVQNLRYYFLTLNLDLGFAALTASSGWSKIDSVENWDVSSIFSPLVPGYSNALVGDRLQDAASRFTEEVRLTSSDERRLQWMLGGFYTDEGGKELSELPSYSSSGTPLPASANPILRYLAPTARAGYREVATFGNATYKFTDRFDVTGGVRYAENHETNDDLTEIAIPALGSTGYFSGRSQASVATWMTTARFHLDRDMMTYARAATGYRPGGPQVSVFPGVPLSYKPDSLTSYEIGFKGEVLDHRLQVDLSAFYIDWRDIQLQVENPSSGVFYTGNAGSANSTGFELTTAYKVGDNLQLGASLAHTDAHLTQDALTIGGRNGDRLPEAPRWSSSVMADYRRSLDSRKALLLGGDYRYVDALSNQLPGAAGGSLPASPQNVVDLYAGLALEKLTVRLYGKNIFQDRSYTGLFLLNPRFPMFVPVQPRTIGLTVDFAF